MYHVTSHQTHVLPSLGPSILSQRKTKPTKKREESVVFMSSTEQVTSRTSYIQLIINALGRLYEMPPPTLGTGEGFR